MGWGYGIDIILAVVMCSALDPHDTDTWIVEVSPHPTLILEINPVPISYSVVE